ncbi:MAG: hypothetical protein WC708_11685 [Lentisphaeria bacterium]
MKRAILIVGLLALPATASANVGAPIAPGVGLELGLYLPGLILIEFLVLRLTLPLTWKQALACSTEWNIITTLVGFPVVLLRNASPAILPSWRELTATGSTGRFWWQTSSATPRFGRSQSSGIRFGDDRTITETRRRSTGRE